jgi:hypothetical protein
LARKTQNSWKRPEQKIPGQLNLESERRRRKKKKKEKKQKVKTNCRWRRVDLCWCMDCNQPDFSPNSEVSILIP